MARLSGTLQSEVSELKRVLNDQEASASEKKKELQVITYSTCMKLYCTVLHSEVSNR